MVTADQKAGDPVKRVMVSTLRKSKAQTVVLYDELPPLERDEIRMKVDKVGLSANNMFYAQMGDAPFLKFFSVYPVRGRQDLANVPVWGSATVVASANPDFEIGEQYRGFLHITNVVQMKARRTPEGFAVYGGERDKLNKAYNGFIRVKDSKASPFHGTGDKADLATVAGPGALSGFLLGELLRMNAFYGGNGIVLTSASSKLSLATAFLLKGERAAGTIQRVIGYSSPKNADFVRSTGLFDDVLTYDQDLPSDTSLRPVFIDVAGDATIYRRIHKRLAKGLVVGATHAAAKSSTFTAFGPSSLLKLVGSMIAPPGIGRWLDRNLHPPLEMFFAPTVMADLAALWGRRQLDEKSDAAVAAFVDAAVDNHWITVVRAETATAIQSEYRRIVEGTVPPSEAVLLSLADSQPAHTDKSTEAALR